MIEAYRTLRDRGPYPADQVVKDLEGSFAFVVYDSKGGNVFAALVCYVFLISCAKQICLTNWTQNFWIILIWMKFINLMSCDCRVLMVECSFTGVLQLMDLL